MTVVNTPPGGATQGAHMHKHHHGHKPPAQGQDPQKAGDYPTGPSLMSK